MNEFFAKLAEITETDEITESTALASLPAWDSLAVLSIIAMLGADYGVHLNARAVNDAKTAGGLWSLVAIRRPAQ